MRSKIAERELRAMKDVISRYPAYSFFVFGSRVDGNPRNASDIDVIVDAKRELSLLEFANLNDDFMESSVSLMVDLHDKYSISDEFFSEIENQLINIVP